MTKLLEVDATFSHSQIDKYLACEQAYAYGYRDQWEAPFKSRAMVLGTIIHKLLDDWWIGLDTFIDFDEVLDYVIKNEETATLEDCKSIAQHAQWLMQRYNKMYEGHREKVEVISVEEHYTFPLPKFGERTYALNTKIDKVMHSPDYGGLVFMDHKTTGKKTKHEATADIDPQMSIYFLALQHKGLDIVIALLDMIFTYQNTKNKKPVEWDAVRVEDSFARYPVDRNEAMLDQAAQEAYWACDRMWHLRQGHFRPLKRLSLECTWCDFRAPCYESLQGDQLGEQAVLQEYFLQPGSERPPLRTNSDPNEVEINR